MSTTYRSHGRLLRMTSIWVILFLPLLSGCVTGRMWDEYDELDRPLVRQTKSVAALAFFDGDNSLVLSVRGSDFSQVIPEWDSGPGRGALTVAPSNLRIARLLRDLPPSAEAQLHVLVKMSEPREGGKTKSETPQWRQSLTLEVELSGSTADPDEIAVIEKAHARVDSTLRDHQVRWSIEESGPRPLTAQHTVGKWSAAPPGIRVQLDCEYWTSPRGWPFALRALGTPLTLAIDTVILPFRVLYGYGKWFRGESESSKEQSRRVK